MIEIIATIMGLIQGGLVWANKRSNWIFYCLQYALLFIFNLQAKLYGDVTNSVIYFLIGILGFILWNRQNGKVPIKHCSTKEKIIYVSIIIISTIVLYFILNFTDDPLPLMDALTTTTGYLATYYMLTKKVDAWILWFINDILYIIEYYILPERAWYLITLNIIWTIMAIGSFISWNKLSKEQK